MIFELAGILDNQTCDEIIEFYEANPELYCTTNAQEMFKGTTMEMAKVTGPLSQKLEALKTRVLIKAAKFYNVDELYVDYWNIVKWVKGKRMEFHADNVTETREPHSYCGWRDFSSIIYLNHNYTGGETVFKHQGQRVVPMQGTACLFPATFGYTHGVSEVLEGTRYTISIWMTKDPNHCWVK